MEDHKVTNEYVEANKVIQELPPQEEVDLLVALAPAGFSRRSSTGHFWEEQPSLQEKRARQIGEKDLLVSTQVAKVRERGCDESSRESSDETVDRKGKAKEKESRERGLNAASRESTADTVDGKRKGKGKELSGEVAEVGNNGMSSSSLDSAVVTANGRGKEKQNIWVEDADVFHAPIPMPIPVEDPDGADAVGRTTKDNGRTISVGDVIMASGGCYQGQWLGSQAHGFGTYIRQDGMHYVGQWQNDNKSGQGFLRWPDGCEYKGEFLMGAKHGHGIDWNEKGDKVYEGEYKDNRMDGYGERYFLDGRIYKGQWQNGDMNGHGSMSWLDGSQYIGSFREGKLDGEGTMTFPEGRTYEGQWKLGKLDGHGTTTDAFGEVEQYVWKNGNIVVEGSEQVAWVADSLHTNLKFVED